jgi:serine/threonine protein kinase
MSAVLLDHAGRVKLADFGIACIKSGNYVTVTNMCGTAAYTAPEVFENQRVRTLLHVPRCTIQVARTIALAMTKRNIGSSTLVFQRDAGLSVSKTACPACVRS